MSSANVCPPLFDTLVGFNMAHVVSSLDQPSNYKDSQTRVDRQRQNDLLAKSTTLYVGRHVSELFLPLTLACRL